MGPTSPTSPTALGALGRSGPQLQFADACDQPTYLPAVYHAVDQPIYQLRTMQSTNLSMTCVQNHAINQSIYELYAINIYSRS